MSSNQEAKKRLPINISTNIAEVGLTAIINLWLTSYFIKNLGVASYGMIPLTSILVRYFNVAMMVLTTSVGRFVAISIGKGDLDEANQYFNSSFWGLISISIILLVPLIIIAVYFPEFFNVPSGQTSSSRILLTCVLLSALMSAITSPFMIGCFVKHRFALANVGKIFSRILQVAVVVCAFAVFEPSLVYVGAGYLAMSVFLLIYFFISQKSLIPQFFINKNLFNRRAFIEMGTMGIWSMIDQIGTLLYLNIDLIIINIFLGVESVGKFAPLLQWVIFLRVMAPALSSVFAPVAFDYIANDRLNELAQQINRILKYLSIIFAFFTGGICGFSKPLLSCWLDDSFIHLWPLMAFLIMPQTIFLSFNPLYNINRGLNKVKIPSMITLIGGILNLILALSFVKYTDMGLWGVAVASIVSYSLRSIFFTPIYTALQLKVHFYEFFISILPGFFLSLAIGLTAWWWSTIRYRLVFRHRLECSFNFINLYANCILDMSE